MQLLFKIRDLLMTKGMRRIIFNLITSSELISIVDQLPKFLLLLTYVNNNMTLCDSYNFRLLLIQIVIMFVGVCVTIWLQNTNVPNFLFPGRDLPVSP